MKLVPRVRWHLLPSAPQAYLRASSLPLLITQLLYNRGVQTDEVESFWTIDHRLEGDPFLLPDMTPAVDRIYKALLSRERIAIYGDFDVDGITATVVLAEGLSWLGGEVVPYIPDRVDEGHGLNAAAMERLGSQGISLIITVDCGVSNIKEVQEAGKLGMDVVITDHHLPFEVLPPAVAVVDAKRSDSRYPFSNLAAVGVALKLLQALFYRDSRKAQLRGLLDLVALGTVDDMVPLVGENRYLVSTGLGVLNNTSRLGLQELIKQAGLEIGKIDAGQISHTLGPRLNAAGRTGDALASYHLLTARSLDEAYSLAVQLERRNRQRQKLTTEVLDKVKKQIQLKAKLPVIIEGDEEYPVGVIGIVASRLAREFNKPVIIVNLGDELCRGSCRSIAEFNISLALEECRDLLVTFGGHPLAAGFAVKRENLAQLEKKLMDLGTSQLSHLDIQPKLTIDAEIPLSTLNSEILNLIQKLAPFGEGNPQPTFLSRGVEVVESHNFGNEGMHLELKLRQNHITWQAFDFNSQQLAEEIPTHIDIVYQLGKGYWGDEEVLRLNLVDFATG
jgi:single-stranded-DNA-specific exonuclease